MERILPQIKANKPELRLLIGADDVRLREAHEHMWATLDKWEVSFTKAIVPDAPHTAEHVLGGLNNDGMQFWWNAMSKVTE